MCIHLMFRYSTSVYMHYFNTFFKQSYKIVTPRFTNEETKGQRNLRNLLS
jgi:hypothetical protein